MTAPEKTLGKDHNYRLKPVRTPAANPVNAWVDSFASAIGISQREFGVAVGRSGVAVDRRRALVSLSVVEYARRGAQIFGATAEQLQSLEDVVSGIKVGREARKKVIRRASAHTTTKDEIGLISGPVEASLSVNSASQAESSCRKSSRVLRSEQNQARKNGGKHPTELPEGVLVPVVNPDGENEAESQRKREYMKIIKNHVKSVFPNVLTETYLNSLAPSDVPVVQKLAGSSFGFPVEFDNRERALIDYLVKEGLHPPGARIRLKPSGKEGYFEYMPKALRQVS